MTSHPKRPLRGWAAENAAKQRCDRGHSLTDSRNVYTHTDKHGHRHRWCRACATYRAAQRRLCRPASTDAHERAGAGTL
jgi:hypothetical protein